MPSTSSQAHLKLHVLCFCQDYGQPGPTSSCSHWMQRQSGACYDLLNYPTGTEWHHAVTRPASICSLVKWASPTPTQRRRAFNLNDKKGREAKTRFWGSEQAFQISQQLPRKQTITGHLSKQPCANIRSCRSLINHSILKFQMQAATWYHRGQVNSRVNYSISIISWAPFYRLQW